MISNADVIIVGGGLAGSLTALRFATTKPELNVLLIEETDRLGGHGSWHFFDSDLSADAMAWIRSIGILSWPETQVRFPKSERTLACGYHILRSEELHKATTERLGSAIRFQTKVAQVSNMGIVLETGDIIEAPLVLDARGIESGKTPHLYGYHKQMCFDLTLESEHGVTTAISLDTTCPQIDGLRYYALFPLDAKRLHIIEGYYSDTADVNVERITRSVQSYAERKGWKISSIDRQETNIHALPLTVEYLPILNEGEAIPIGRRGGYFHPTTGNSLADAVRAAEFFTTTAGATTQNAREVLHKFRRPWLSRQRFYRILNRMMFYAAEPSLRYQVMQRLYEQPLELIQRFHSSKTSWADRIRLLRGKSPVPLDRAFKSLGEGNVIARAKAASPQGNAAV